MLELEVSLSLYLVDIIDSVFYLAKRLSMEHVQKFLHHQQHLAKPVFNFLTYKRLG